jgi:hypothetical protein
MKKFIDKTDSLKEPAIKTGNFVPRDAINLGWFSSKDINPENNMVIADLSSLIPENINNSQVETKLMFANALGILEDENGISEIDSEEVFLSDTFINERVSSERYMLESLSEKKYAMSYYPSRYFTLVGGFNSVESNLNSFTEEMYIPNNIQVLDSNNEHYADKETGRKKYRIELENFITPFNNTLNERPSKILVFLEDPNPENFTLQYDKVECDENGKWSNQILKYSETINALPMFRQVQEESEVIDPFNSDSKIFSVKRSSKRQMLQKSTFNNDSNQIFVNQKAVDDNRNFQLFNWRIVGRIKSAVNLNEINYGNVFPNGAINEIKVGVLYSSNHFNVTSTSQDNPSYKAMLSKVNPYVFYNLQESVLNLNKLTFVNPNASTADKASAAYWLVDIDQITDLEIESYDALVCSLSWNLTNDQAAKLSRVSESYSSILFDVSQAGPNALVEIDPNFTATLSTSIPTSITQIYNENNNFILKSSTNAFDISISEFAEDCGIYGYSKTANGNYKPYSFFANNNLDSVLKINNTNIVASKRIVNSGDTHKASNIVASTASILSYANSIYSGSFNISTPNIELNALPVNSDRLISNYSDGPLKFLYNFVSVALNDKLESNRVSQNLNSTIHYFTTLWKNDWTLDSDALFEEEKEIYFTNQTVDNETIIARSVLSNPRISYIKELQAVIPGVREAFLDQNDQNIDLFIEYTNPNIGWTNSTAASSQDILDLASSYNVVKINNKTASCNAYSNVKSDPFILPSDYGLHVIKDRPESEYNNNFSIKPSSQIRNYTFDLQLSHKKISLADAPKFFDASVAITAHATFKQARQTIVRYDPVSDNGTEAIPGVPGSDYNFTPTTEKYTTSQESTSAQKLLTDIRSPLNAYSYTGDIDQGNVSSSFSSGSTGDYVRYIQFTLSCAGYRTTINSSYDSQTVDNVKAFQTASGILSDGVVDSQTKSYLGLFWGNLYRQDINDYNGKFALVKNNNVKKYITAASNTILADDALATDTPVKLINFTGVAQSQDPDEIQLWISFPIVSGENYSQLNSITITPEDFSANATSYNGIQILDYRFDQEPTHSPSGKAGRFIDRTDKNAPLTIQINTPKSLGKFASILIKGSPLGGSFGSKAEGIGIKNISYSVTSKSTTPVGGADRVPPKIIGYDPIREALPTDVNGIVTLNLPVKNISATNKTFTVDKNILLQFASLASIEVYQDQSTEQNENKWPTYTGLSGVTLNQTEYQPGSSLGRQEKINLSNPINIKITSVSVVPSSIKESGNSSNTFYSNSFMDIVPVADSNIFSCVVRASTYPSPNTYNFGPIPIANYKLKSAINGNIKAGTNTINFYDGPMLICNDDGSPYTINISNIANASPPIPNTASVYNSDLEVTSVSQIDPGLKYGFYDSVTSKFIGTKISYNKYIQNAANIYVAVYAYDYDGNLETISESTSLDQDTIIPAQVPIKTAYPVYLLRTSNINKIQLRQTQKNLDKTEPWPIMISSGSFYKNIFVPRRRAPGSDVSLTVGMELVAKYDTSSSESAAPSKLFGKKYYDVVDETPEIINRYSIKTKQTPIHYIHEIPSDLIRFVTPINAIVSVYTRLDEDSAWQLIPKNKIQDINCKTGLIKFIDPLISSDENLTKVSYTIKMNNIMFKHSNGVPIPTNPFLNRDQIRINKPLYIYLLPKEVYQESSAGLEIVEEYSSASIVNFTYDNNIFNKLDVFNYNPYALLIGIVYTVNNFRDEDFTFTDLRTKGGGVSANFDTNQIISDIKESISYWDVYPPLSEAYPKGGYVIIKVPTSIKRNFTNPDEVYRIVKDNITAGVVFELQDMDGKDWGSSVTVPS